MALQAIEGATPLPGCNAGKLEVVELDLGSMASVRELVKAERARKEPLDILICNAGVMAPPKRIQTVDGFEQQFQVTALPARISTAQSCNKAGYRTFTFVGRQA